MGPVSKLTCLAEKQHLLKTTQSENCCGFNNKRQKNCSTDGAKMLPIMKQTALKGLQHLGSQLRVKHLQHLRTLSLQVQTVCADLWPPTMFLKSELFCKPSQRRQEAWGGSGGDDGAETLKTKTSSWFKSQLCPKTHKHVKSFLKLHSDSTLHSSLLRQHVTGSHQNYKNIHAIKIRVKK